MNDDNVKKVAGGPAQDAAGAPAGIPGAAAPEDRVLEINGLRVIYRSGEQTVRAVNGISLSIGRGRTLGLVGETGAGKTTTALSVMRLLPDRSARIEEGSIRFGGRELLSLSEGEMRELRGRKISMIFQDPMTSLNPVMTVGEQIEEALKYHMTVRSGSDTLTKRVDETLELVGIPSSRRGEYPHQFSGGMKQRVVIAMALACEPELLIADEPTTALDVTIQSQVLSMMSELHDRLGMTMLLITHDLGVIADMSDDVAVMYAGQIVEYGTVEDIYLGADHHPYTEGLFGSIPDINVRTRRLKPVDGLMPDPTDLPPGCSFAPRCPYATDVCRQQAPPVRSRGTHTIACHRAFSGNENDEQQ